MSLEKYTEIQLHCLIYEAIKNEREACIKIALSCVSPVSIDDWTDGHDYARHQIADAIRSRSEAP